jgi:predicted outer membrane repeat protein
MRKVFFGFGAILVLALPAAASADVYDVVPGALANNDNVCQLVEAVAVSNSDTPNANDCPIATAGPDTINLTGGTYSNFNALNVGDPTSGDMLTIQRSTPTPVTLTATNDRVMLVLLNTAGVTLNGVTVSGAAVASGGYGGGIQVQSTLVMNNSVVSGNSIGDANNFGYGGGIVAQNNPAISVTLTNTTVSGNTASTDGGGIRMIGAGTLNLDNVTIANNTANSDNDSLAVPPGDGGDGGGLWVAANVDLHIRNTIIAGNHQLGDTSTDCLGMGEGGVTSAGGNVIGANTAGCDFVPTATDHVGNPLLGPLQDNGGPNGFTHAIGPGSIALDNGVNTGPCPATDQRGLPRPFPGTACDSGAFEYQVPPSPPPAAAGPTGQRAAALKKCKKKKSKKARKKCKKKALGLPV